MGSCQQKIIPFEFDYIGEYRKGDISAEKSGKWGLINERGETIIPFEYESIYNHQNNEIIRVKLNGKWGVVNRDNIAIVPFEFEDIGIFANGRAKAKKIGKWGVIDDRGDTKCPFDFDRIHDENNYYWEVMKCDYTYENRPVRRQNRWGGTYYKDNYWKVSHEKWGLVNMEGEIIIPCEYENIYAPINGIIRCKKNKRWGCVNEKNEIIIPFEFDYINQFVEGKAEVQKNSRTSYINENGEEIYNIRPLSNGLIVYGSAFLNRCGLMNAQRDAITGLEYSIIKEFNNGIAWAMKDDLWERGRNYSFCIR